MKRIAPNVAGSSLRIAIVQSRFNPAIGEGLLGGAMRALREAGVPDDHVTQVSVPGALEAPLALQRLAQTDDYDALVVLGAVIRGETYHFEVVSNESAAGVSSVALESGIPIGNGILTCETDAQAQSRMDQKGYEATLAAIEMANLLRAIDTASSARRRSRELALQGLYQRQLSGNDAQDVRDDLAASKGYERADRAYFEEIWNGVTRDYDALVAAVEPHLARKASELSPIERAILVIAAWELRSRLDIPYRVVINEAVELAKGFGATDGHRFVNGVLDKVAADLRAAEIAAR